MQQSQLQRTMSFLIATLRWVLKSKDPCGLVPMAPREGMDTRPSLQKIEMQWPRYRQCLMTTASDQKYIKIVCHLH